MHMKTRKPVQIGTVVFALSMLAAYVVYSQRQHDRSVAPSLKGMAITTGNEPWAAAGRTNNVPDREHLTVAPGSKSDVPVLTRQPTFPAPAATASAAHVRSLMIAPGSKSGPVFDRAIFDLTPKEVAEKATFNELPRRTIWATNIAVPIKH